MESLMNILFFHTDQDNLDLNSRDEIIQKVKTTDSSAQTSDEQFDQPLSEVIIRGKLPMLPAEHSFASITKEQGRGETSAQTNGLNVQMVINFQTQLQHFTEALNALTTQHNELVNYLCTNANLDKLPLDIEGKQLQQNVDQIGQNQAVLQNLVEELGSFHLNVSPSFSRLEPPSQQRDLRSETLARNIALSGASSTPRSAQFQEDQSKIQHDPLSVHGATEDNTKTQRITASPCLKTMGETRSPIANGQGIFSAAYQSLAGIGRASEDVQHLLNVSQDANFNCNIIEMNQIEMNDEGDQQVDLPVCPSIPQRWPSERYTVKKEPVQGLMIASDEMISLQTEPAEEPDNTSDPYWWKKKAENSESSLWREYGHCLANIMLQNEKESDLQNDMVAKACTPRVDDISMDEEVLQWLGVEGQHGDNVLLDQRQSDPIIIATDAVDQLKQDLAEKDEQLSLSQQENIQLKQQLQLLQQQEIKNKEEKQGMEEALQQAQSELLFKSVMATQENINIQNAHQEEVTELKTKASQAQAAIEESKILQEQISKLQERHRLQLEVQATKSREQWEQNGLLSDENEAQHIQIQSLDMKIESQYQEIEEKYAQLSQLQDQLKEIQAENSQLEMDKASAEAKAELVELQKAELERQVLQNKKECAEELAFVNRKCSQVEEQEQTNRNEDNGQQKPKNIVEGSIQSVSSASVQLLQHSVDQTEEQEQHLKQDISQLRESRPNKQATREPQTSPSSPITVQQQSIPPQNTPYQIPPGFPAQPRFKPRSQIEATGLYIPLQQQKSGLIEQNPPLNQQTKCPELAPQPGPSVKRQSGIGVANIANEKESRLEREFLQEILPIYEGGPNVNHFLNKFENMVKRTCINEKDKYILLVGQVQGAAEQWLTQQPGFREWNTPEIMKALKEQYDNIQDTSVDKLESMVCRGDLHKFNDEFLNIGTGCLDKCPEFMQKRIYIKAMRPYHFQQTLHGLSIATGMSLPHLMTTAVELQPFYKRRPRRPDTEGVAQKVQGEYSRKERRRMDHSQGNMGSPELNDNPPTRLRHQNERW